MKKISEWVLETEYGKYLLSLQDTGDRQATFIQFENWIKSTECNIADFDFKQGKVIIIPQEDMQVVKSKTEKIIMKKGTYNELKIQNIIQTMRNGEEYNG